MIAWEQVGEDDEAEEHERGLDAGRNNGKVGNSATDRVRVHKSGYYI